MSTRSPRQTAATSGIKGAPLMDAAQRGAYVKMSRRRRRQMLDTRAALEHACIATTVQIHKAMGKRGGNELCTLAVLLDMLSVGWVKERGTTWSPDRGAEHLRSKGYSRIWSI